MDKRLKLQGFEQAKKFFDLSMEYLELNIKPMKETARQSLIGGIYPGWLNFNMNAINGYNFNLKTLKHFFCYRILQLSKEEKLPISEYYRFFDLSKSSRYFMEPDRILEYLADPVELLQQLRKVAYETYLNFVQTKHEEEETEGRMNAKAAAYVEFAHAMVLYDLFVQSGITVIECSLDDLLEAINTIGEQEGLPVRAERSEECLTVYIPLCTVPDLRVIEELIRVESRHVIALYALRTMVQLTEYLSTVNRISGSRLELIAAPVKKERYDNAIKSMKEGTMSELLSHLQVSTRGAGVEKHRSFLKHYSDKALVARLFLDYRSRTGFLTECQEYLNWMEQWLKKDEAWRMQEDAVIMDENHPEVNIASIVFSDAEGDFLPGGKVPGYLLQEAFARIGTGLVA